MGLPDFGKEEWMRAESFQQGKDTNDHAKQSDDAVLYRDGRQLPDAPSGEEGERHQQGQMDRRGRALRGGGVAGGVPAAGGV